MENIIKIQCPSCGVKLKVPGHFQGSEGKCPKCGAGVCISKQQPLEEIPSILEDKSEINHKCEEFDKDTHGLENKDNIKNTVKTSEEINVSKKDVFKALAPELFELFKSLIKLLLMIGAIVFLIGLVWNGNSSHESKKYGTGKSIEEIAKEKKEHEIIQGRQWYYREAPDEMGRGTIRMASIRSLNEFEFDFPYQGSQRATLILRKHPKHGNDVMLSVEKGQFICDIDSCSVDVRFDEGNVMSFSVGEPADYDTTTLFIQDYDLFLDYLHYSKTVYIEARFFQEGTEVFEFNVSGLDW